MPPLGRRERLAEVYRRLDTLPAPASAEEALSQLRECLNAVEDELSGIPAVDPPPADGGGRMYFPLPDRTVIHADGGITARTIGHTITVTPDGHLTIRRTGTGEVEYQK